MSNKWDAEYILKKEEALDLVSEQFEELKPLRIKLLGEGWDNVAYLINEEYVFRFPRREIAVPLLENEADILPRISEQLPLPIPRPKWRGKPSGNFPWPFLGYRLMPGITACRAHLTHQERIATAKPLAHFLSSLHSITLTGDLPKDLFNKADSQRLIREIQQKVKELKALGLIEQEFGHITEKTYRLPELTALIHGDFYIRHLLVDEKHLLSGVIDWGDVHFGDIAVDLAIAHSFLPVEAHENFRRHYGKISEETWELAKLRALFSSLYLVHYGHNVGDEAIKREGLLSLQQL